MHKYSHLLMGLGLLALLTACNGAGGYVVPTATPGPPAVRITVDADGNVVLVEGHDFGNWEPALKMVSGRPESLGRKIASIDMYEHNGSDVDVVASDGTSSAHAHSGPTTPPWTSHCHTWLAGYLVHCR